MAQNKIKLCTNLLLWNLRLRSIIEEINNPDYVVSNATKLFRKRKELSYLIRVGSTSFDMQYQLRYFIILELRAAQSQLRYV